MTYTFERGFKEKHLKILLNYCKMTKIDPRVTYSQFHRKYRPYSREQSTMDLINAAYTHRVITGPVLYANTGIEVKLMDNINDPLEYLKKCKEDEKTTLAYALHGDWSFIHFRYGASMLKFADSILPHSYSNSCKYIEDIRVEEQKAKLPQDPYPHGWSDEHWDVYKVLRTPRSLTFRDVGKQIGLSWDSVKKYFYEVLRQCKVHSCFFPLGKNGYSHHVITFETEYEVSILRALKKLNRTTYIYKTQEMIILILFLIPRPLDFNISTNFFKELEEKGYIRDLHVCTPRKWHNTF
ncbi:MAG: hypothetical protein HXS48_17345 [Theionarchaea archaeon]|nr:hypothetical protein [Theionarchaea archaeon]